jgi:hypothetical protein
VASRQGVSSLAACDGHKNARSEAHSSHGGGSRKPALAAGAKAAKNKRFGFAARPKQEMKKHG